MGIICQDERKKTNKNRNNNNNNEIDITQNSNKETEDSIHILKNEIKKDEDTVDEMLSKINEKFNIINMSKSRDNFNFSKIEFKLQEDQNPSITININENVKMNQIYQKIKNKKAELPSQKDLTFFYLTLNITSLFNCNLEISKFNIDLSNPISIIYNNIQMPEIWNIN